MRQLKSAIFLLWVLILPFNALAQDIIYKEDGGQIKASVKEIGLNVIKYKRYQQPDGPLRNIPKYKVYMIKYEDGRKEMFKKQKNQEAQNQRNQKEEIPRSRGEDDDENDRFKSEDFYEKSKKTRDELSTEDDQKSNYSSLGVGYGISYGGIGLNGQYVIRTGGVNIGFDLSLGYFPKFQGYLLGNLGIQFYIAGNFYFDAKFGSFGAYKEEFISSNESGVLYGPSLMAGYDIYTGDVFAIKLGLGASYDMEGHLPVLEERLPDFWPSVDIGFRFRF